MACRQDPISCKGLGFVVADRMTTPLDIFVTSGSRGVGLHQQPEIRQCQPTASLDGLGLTACTCNTTGVVFNNLGLSRCLFGKSRVYDGVVMDSGHVASHTDLHHPVHAGHHDEIRGRFLTQAR